MEPADPALSAGPRPPARRRVLRELPGLLARNADFRRLFLATVASFLGDWFAFVAVSGLVVDLTGREGLAALVYAANVIPVFAASPLAGVVADRVDRKRLFVAVNVAAAVPALGLLAALWWQSAWLAVAALALIGVCAAFVEPVTGAALPNLVPPEDLSLAQAALGSVWGTMLFVGAGIGGVVAATLGRQAAFAINAATFLVAAGLVARVHRPFRAGPLPERASVLTHLGEVWAYVRPRKLTRALMVTKVGVGIGNGIVGLLPAFALTRFGAGDTGIGLLLAARGFGALVGPFIGRAVARDDGRRLLLVCGLAIVCYGAAYTLLPLTGSLALAAACVVLAHTGGGAQWVLSTYGLQVATPDAVRGRVLSLDFGLATLGIGLSSLAAGAGAELVGLEAASWGFAAVSIAYGAAWLWWTRGLWRSPTDPLA
ncbi:MAG TPA: MFS transporter [Egibacteraceae bacterium]|nr:MFS transporter [Egibacteraceae bacterium]